MPEGPWIVVGLAVLGLLIGSFLNVVIARVPEGQSIITPASACPRCGALLRWRDNVPLLSWILLRGRCRACDMPISVRYPLVEATNALLWIALAWWALAVPDRMSLLPLLLVLASAGLALAVIDIEHH
ncbi:MAG TPA: prepilin peptidase, partial [Actinobacteria bacterium]|nr:prepilin peptidase [Actinomycetota bacterium]